MLEAGHKIGYLCIERHSADPVVPACNNTEKLAHGRSVGSDGYGGMACPLFQLQNIGQSIFRCNIGIADDKTCPVIFNA